MQWVNQSIVYKNLPITKVIAITVSGYAARVIAAQMIKQPIIALSNNKENTVLI